MLIVAIALMLGIILVGGTGWMLTNNVEYNHRRIDKIMRILNEHGINDDGGLNDS